jgi:hypothetical protein
MTTRQTFTSEEWDLLGNAPLAAGAAVSVAEPGGGIREAAALVGAWREGAALFPRSELIGAIVADLDPQDREAQERSTGLQARGPQPAFDQIVDEAIDLCDQAIDLLDRKATPQEIEDYRAFVMHVVLRVAKASAEGGLLGLSGDPVSRAERAVLREIAEALGIKHEH